MSRAINVDGRCGGDRGMHCYEERLNEWRQRGDGIKRVNEEREREDEKRKLDGLRYWYTSISGTFKLVQMTHVGGFSKQHIDLIRNQDNW